MYIQTDSFLMKMGWDFFFFKNQTGWDLRKGIKRHFTAWKSPNDPSPGDFTYGIEMQPHSYPEVYIRKGNKKVLPEFNFNLREMNFDFFPPSQYPVRTENNNLGFFLKKNFNMMWLYSIKNKDH